MSTFTDALSAQVANEFAASQRAPEADAPRAAGGAL